MKRLTLLLFVLAFIVSCKNKNKEELVSYNDKIVNIMEQADRIMRTWNNSEIMEDYAENKSAALSKITGLQDSLKLIVPPTSDDTLRLSGISILNGYIQTFDIYDTIYKILADSVYLVEDSIRVQTLLQTNKNMVNQSSSTFSEVQKRFALRYELQFMQ